MHIFNAIDFKTHWTPTIWAVERTSAEVKCHVEFSAFKMVAHEVHHVEHRHLFIRFNPKRHSVAWEVLNSLWLAFHIWLGTLDVTAGGVVPVSVHAVGNFVEHCPHA